MSPERTRLLQQAQVLREDLLNAATAAQAAGQEEDADRLWAAWDQAGDVVEELQGTY